MNDVVLFVSFLLLGYSTGILVGLLGVGGGILFVPILYLFLPYTPVQHSQIPYIVLATSLFTGCIASTSSAFFHSKNYNLEFKKALLLGMGSSLSAILVPLIVVKVEETILQIIFAIIFSTLAIKMFTDKPISQSEKIEKQYPEYLLILLGMLVGVLAAFAGIGGGVLYVPILAFLYNVDFKKAVGSSSIVTAITMFVAAISYAFLTPIQSTVDYQIGYVYLLAGVPLSIGSSFGAILGVKIINKVSIILLKKIFAVLLIIVVLKIIFDI